MGMGDRNEGKEREEKINKIEEKLKGKNKKRKYDSRKGRKGRNVRKGMHYIARCCLLKHIFSSKCTFWVSNFTPFMNEFFGEK